MVQFCTAKPNSSSSVMVPFTSLAELPSRYTAPNLTPDAVLDVLTGLLFLATLGLAVYTGLLRKATVDLAGDTVEGTELSDQHHQEGLSPVCIIKDVLSPG
jgi:hypothetical protein